MCPFWQSLYFSCLPPLFISVVFFPRSLTCIKDDESVNTGACMYVTLDSFSSVDLPLMWGLPARHLPGTLTRLLLSLSFFLVSLLLLRVGNKRSYTKNVSDSGKVFALFWPEISRKEKKERKKKTKNKNLPRFRNNSGTRPLWDSPADFFSIWKVAIEVGQVYIMMKFADENH